MVFVTDNIMQNVSVSGDPVGGGETGGGRPKPANEQEGSWDNIWK